MQSNTRLLSWQKQGYILGTIANVYVVYRLDFGKTIAIGAAGQIIGQCFRRGLERSVKDGDITIGVRRWSFGFTICCDAIRYNEALELLASDIARRSTNCIRPLVYLCRVASLPRINEIVYRQLFRIRALYFCSLFAFAYIGVEISLGGCAVTYLIHRTGAGSSAGYVSSGFFGGLALGRVLLL
ncbi:hypothetical protein ACEPAG_7846 [Sanghuangporus baumii]